MSRAGLINATATNNVPLYAEPQKKRLCAKHALNNILQEEKVGYYPNKPLLVNKNTGKKIKGSESIQDYHVSLNIWQYCTDADIEAIKAAIEGGFLPEDFPVERIEEVLISLESGTIPEDLTVEDFGMPEPACGPQHDNLSFDRVENVVTMLGYKAKTSRAYTNDVLRDEKGEPILFEKAVKNSSGVARIEYETKPDEESQIIREEFWDELELELKSEKLLGVLINKGAWHYTAISKFVKGCSRWERNATRRLASVSYTFLDSYPEINTKCHNLSNMIKYLKENEEINSVIYVYDSPCAYNSVAANRLRRLRALKNTKAKTKKANNNGAV